MLMAAEERKRQADLVIVPLKLPRCPECGTAKQIKVDGVPVNEEETKRQYCYCKACKCRWIQVWD